jgi:V/A-type H+-transporting ATPase subunit E
MTLESPDAKVQEICKRLRKETLEPSKKEAAWIVSEAKKESEEMILAAKQESLRIQEKTAGELAKMLNVHEAAIALALRQGISKLKQSIDALFSNQLHTLIKEEMIKSDTIAKVINAMVQAIEKEGISSNLLALIPAQVSKEEVQEKLVTEVAQKLGRGGIALGDFKAGVEIKLRDKKIAIDMSDEAVIELLSRYIGEDLKTKLYQV